MPQKTGTPSKTETPQVRPPTDPRQGLSEPEVLLVRQQYGSNRLEQAAPISFFTRLWHQVRSPVVLVLASAATFSLLLGEWGDGLAILAILAINTGIGFVQEQKADQALSALESMTHPLCKVLRDGQVREISSPDLVPGDLVFLEAGDSIPADAYVRENQDCWVDESILTGESLPVEKRACTSRELIQPLEPKDEGQNFVLYAGTAMAKGSARAQVTATGMNSRLGHMASLMQKAQRTETPLQVRMAEASQALLWLCAGVIVILVAMGLYHGEHWRSIVFGALSLAVAAIPEGLPTVVTVALALAVRRMSDRKAIVRHLPSVETLGSCTVICTDKTGTLTSGRMEAREWVLEVQEDPQPCVPSQKVLSERERHALEVAVLASTASFSREHGGAGDTTEVALLRLADGWDLPPDRLQAIHPIAKEWSFDSQRKRMSLCRQKQGTWHLYAKGAPEAILPLCHLTENEREKLEATVDQLSRKGQRLLALAERSKVCSAAKALASLSADDVEKDLSFVGLLALADPPRPESKASLEACHQAGIQVVMITGDHPMTAEAIASELHLIPSQTKARVVSGSQLKQWSDDDLLREVHSIHVYARVSPDDKLRIIEAWKKRGATVAMTGDGVNDAPALKAASIGIAMGKGGTEVARQAASLVLTDDNFASIVAAIEEGRGVFGNIKRTILYLLTGNLAEIGLMLGAAVMGMPFPLWPIHLLWINLVTDGLPSLALAAEPRPKRGHLQGTKPSPASFFDASFYREIIAVGLLVTGIGLSLYDRIMQSQGVEAARTAVFTFVVWEELFRSFASRSERIPYLSFQLPLHPFHLAAVGIPFLLQVILLKYPEVFSFFKVAPLPFHEILQILAWALVPVTLLELRKMFTRS